MADEDSFRTLTYNAAGMNDEDISDALELLWADMHDQWDIILFQEGPKSEDETLRELVGGHLWYVAACQGRHRSVAVLLHQRWTLDIQISKTRV